MAFNHYSAGIDFRRQISGRIKNIYSSHKVLIWNGEELTKTYSQLMTLNWKKNFSLHGLCKNILGRRRWRLPSIQLNQTDIYRFQTT